MAFPPPPCAPLFFNVPGQKPVPSIFNVFSFFPFHSFIPFVPLAPNSRACACLLCAKSAPTTSYSATIAAPPFECSCLPSPKFRFSPEGGARFFPTLPFDVLLTQIIPLHVRIFGGVRVIDFLGRRDSIPFSASDYRFRRLKKNHSIIFDSCFCPSRVFTAYFANFKA